MSVVLDKSLVIIWGPQEVDTEMNSKVCAIVVLGDVND